MLFLSRCRSWAAGFRSGQGVCESVEPAPARIGGVGRLDALEGAAWASRVVRLSNRKIKTIRQLLLSSSSARIAALLSCERLASQMRRFSLFIALTFAAVFPSFSQETPPASQESTVASQDNAGVAGDNSVESDRKIVNRFFPSYPKLARTMNLKGNVRVEALVAPDGKVKSVAVKGGHPILAQAAEDAIYKWRWAPAKHETKEAIELRFSPR
jgi:TonB family protein